MNEKNLQPIVVAVGHDPLDAALEFAAEVATREGCGLRLVHVVHGAELPATAETSLEKAGREALNAALELARKQAPDVSLSAELVNGPVVPTLIEDAGSARMIVLQHRHLSTVRRVVTRSIASGVAAHARMPVVCVPSRWTAADREGKQPVVAVGVDVAERARYVLQAAAGEARARGAELRVLHAWRATGAYEDIIFRRRTVRDDEDETYEGIIFGRTEDAEMNVREAARVQAALDDRQEDLAGVPVALEVGHAFPADALIEASRGADLLVMGRHDPVLPIGSHLGPIARAVLRESEAPVLLVDPDPARRW